MSKMRWIFVLLLSLFIFTSCAKGLYIGKLAWGEAKILWGSIPVQEALRDEGMAQGAKERLRLVQEVKEFAQEKIGLSLDGCYEAFYRVKGDTLIYLVSACPKDSLEPYPWRFPIVGEVSYKGFFDKKDALEELKSLEERGLDTCLQRAMAFSTLGWLNDPIYSTILDRHPVVIINTIIHELVHNTIFLKGETEFNEQIASFVGGKGALMFIEERFGSSSPYYQLALDLARDEELVAGFIQKIYDELKGVYAQEMSWDEKMRRREEIFAQGKRRFADLRGMLKTGYLLDLDKEKFNNALIVAYKRYLNPPDSLLHQVYETLGCDLRNFIELLKGLKKTRESPYLYLEKWLWERSKPPSD
ncbi:MAG: aminopeptidase [Deltaproteobacteria bacterium]|nr:aminopeptidase [Deltaproteobacteria bacterium]